MLELVQGAPTSALRVRPGGQVPGLDMAESMLELARRSAAEAGVDHDELVSSTLLAAAEIVDVDITETNRVRPPVSPVRIRTRKPSTSPETLER